MSEKRKKDQIRIQTLEEFEKVDKDSLKERYDRYVWSTQEWIKIVRGKINRPPHIDTLYTEGSRAFFYGYYTASILTISAAIELTLKAIVDLSLFPPKLNKSFSNVIKEAVKQKIISTELGKNLHFLRKNTRNILTHDQNMALHMTLGWEKDPESKTGHMLSDGRLEKLVSLQHGSKNSLFTSREVFAKETIQLLFKIFKSIIDSGKDWSNLVENQK